MRLDEKTAVITGGGRGIGAAVANALAKAGAAVVVASRTASDIEGVASGLVADGHRAWAIRCDVSDPSSVQNLAAAAAEHLGQVDILVNSAGIGLSAPIQKITLEDWNTAFAVNATGSFLCIQAFLPGMVERQWGRVVNVASVAGLTGLQYTAAYSASKHAVIGLTRCVGAEVAKKGVTVNAVCPGFVNTDMTVQSIDRIVEKTGITREDALQGILGTTPQDRLFQPEEVAHAVLSLCDEQARGINGQTIVIDGGALLA